MSRNLSPTPSALPPVPSSPTYSLASTANPLPSHLNLPLPPTPPSRPHAILSKNDLAASHYAYDTLLTTAKAYRQALAALATTASAFGTALESCARLKEARSESLQASARTSMAGSFTGKGTCTADNLMAASGVHFLVANHQQILSECLYRSFEVPLLHELDHWRRGIEEEEEGYQRQAQILSKEIRKMEKDGLKLHRQRKRDVGALRGHLVALTGKLDGLTSLHGEHARRLLRDSQETSLKIVDASGSLVKAEMDIFEALARKGWAGGGLDELLDRGRDLLGPGDDDACCEETENEQNTIFSILPQKSILPDTTSSPEPKRRRADSLMEDPDRYQSLAGAVGGREAETMSIFSESRLDTSGILNRSRGARPFSPPPSMNRVSKDPLDPDVGSKIPNDGGLQSTEYDEVGGTPPHERCEPAPATDDAQYNRGRSTVWDTSDESGHEP